MVNNYFGESVNKVVLPEYGKDAILKSIKHSEYLKEDNEIAERNTALDFYYNRNLDSHIDEWFSGSKHLRQVPAFPQSIVPRFARARMLLYKNPPLRLLDGEESDDYKSIAYHLNTKTREMAELTWLMGDASMRTKWNTNKERLEYDILPNVKKYYVNGESEPFAVSYEIGRAMNSDRQFVFWSESRDGEMGQHFMFSQSGKIKAVPGNPEMVNPYGIIPISHACYQSNALDVVRAAVQISIAMTEIALGIRFNLGQPIARGITDQDTIESGIDKLILLSDPASSFEYVSPNSDIRGNLESIKLMINQVAQNHSLAVRWGEGGTPPSGEALKIMSMENLEVRESDIPLWREWEQSRYEIDNIIYQTHTGKSLPETLAIDYAEAGFPKSVSDETAWIEFQLRHNLITRKELLLKFNPDMSDAELKSKMGELEEEKIAEAPAEAPVPQTATPLLDILQA